LVPDTWVTLFFLKQGKEVEMPWKECSGKIQRDLFFTAQAGSDVAFLKAQPLLTRKAAEKKALARGAPGSKIVTLAVAVVCTRTGPL